MNEIRRLLQAKARDACYNGAKRPILPRSVMDHPLLDSSLEQVLADPGAFLRAFRELPHVGEVSTRKIEIVLRDALARLTDALGASPAGQDLDGLRQIVLSARGHFEGGAAFNVQARCHPDAMSSTDFSPDRVLRRVAEVRRFAYVSATIPDFLKTKAVWRAEHGAEGPDSAYLGLLEVMRAGSRPADFSGIVSCDARALTALLGRFGKYGALSEDDVAAQIGVIRDFQSTTGGGIDIRVCDHQSWKLSSSILVPDAFVLLYLFGAYLEIESLPLYASFHNRFQVAMAQAPALMDFVARSDG